MPWQHHNEFVLVLSSFAKSDNSMSVIWTNFKWEGRKNNNLSNMHCCKGFVVPFKVTAASALNSPEATAGVMSHTFGTICQLSHRDRTRWKCGWFKACALHDRSKRKTWRRNKTKQASLRGDEEKAVMSVKIRRFHSCISVY